MVKFEIFVEIDTNIEYRRSCLIRLQILHLWKSFIKLLTHAHIHTTAYVKLKNSSISSARAHARGAWRSERVNCEFMWRRLIIFE